MILWQLPHHPVRTLAILLALLLRPEIVEASSTGWSIVPAANVGTSDNYLYTVAAVSATDVWAAGFYNDVPGHQRTLIEHWHGSGWTVVSSPNVGTSDNYLDGMAIVTSSDIWAVGHAGGDALIEHSDGTHWEVVHSPSPSARSNLLYSVAATSANDVWAVGDYFGFGIQHTLIEHWDGTMWRVVPSPNPTNQGDSYLRGVTAISPDNVWAIGYYDAGPVTAKHTVIEHWNGRRWQLISSPNRGGSNFLFGVATASPADVWAVGYSYAGTKSQVLIERWDGHVWHLVSAPSRGSSVLEGIVVNSATDAWAVGHSTVRLGVQRTLIERWNGYRWTIVHSPSSDLKFDILYGAAATSAGDVWAVGMYPTDSAFQALIEHQLTGGP